MKPGVLYIVLTGWLAMTLACNLTASSSTPETPLPTSTIPEVTTPTAVSLQDSLPEPTSTADERNLVHVLPGEPIKLAYQGHETGPDFVNPDLGPNLAPHPFMQASQKSAEDFGLIHGFSAELIPFDDRCGAGEGASTASALVSDPEIVAVIGPICSASAIEALPIYEIAKIAVISGSATQPDLVLFGPAVFNRVILNDDQMQDIGFVLAVDSEAMPSVHAFHSEFHAWGGAPLIEGANSYLPYQYDAVGVLLSALERTAEVQDDGSLLVDRDLLLGNLREMDNYPGITGPISITSTGDRAP